jgi:hypothetical protein
MLTIVGLHVLGLACVAVLIIPALREGPSPPPHPSDPGSDDGWGHGPKLPPAPPDPPRGGIPLPSAEQSRVRLRDGHGRLADSKRGRERRPAREPHHTPVGT